MSTQIRLSERHCYAAADLFDLVVDVKRYPDFIGPITALRLVEDRSRGDQLDFTAQVRVRYQIVAETFTTRVQADREAGEIKVSFVSGPFRKLSNLWRLRPLSDGSTWLEFELDAEFKNGFLQMMLEKNRERAASRLTQRFIDEAERRYAPSGDPALDLTEEIDALVK